MWNILKWNKESFVTWEVVKESKEWGWKLNRFCDKLRNKTLRLGTSQEKMMKEGERGGFDFIFVGVKSWKKVVTFENEKMKVLWHMLLMNVSKEMVNDSVSSN